MVRIAGYGNRVRIIGGCWRGCRLRFPAVVGLRPTPDRIRETLFNWLNPVLEGAHCLDLFAGSGALGIEALSRGAADVVFVDCHPLVVRHLRANLALLGAGNARVAQATAEDWLRQMATVFDVVFLDPPFGRNLLPPVIERLEQGGWLGPETRIYLESERAHPPLVLPETWEWLQDKTAGEVSYRLAVKRR